MGTVGVSTDQVTTVSALALAATTWALNTPTSAWDQLTTSDTFRKFREGIIDRANTVKGPLPNNVSTNPAALTAALVWKLLLPLQLVLQRLRASSWPFRVSQLYRTSDERRS